MQLNLSHHKTGVRRVGLDQDCSLQGHKLTFLCTPSQIHNCSSLGRWLRDRWFSSSTSLIGCRVPMAKGDRQLKHVEAVVAELIELCWVRSHIPFHPMSCWMSMERLWETLGFPCQCLCKSRLEVRPGCFVTLIYPSKMRTLLLGQLNTWPSHIHPSYWTSFWSDEVLPWIKFSR